MKRVILINLVVVILLFTVLEIGARWIDRTDVGRLRPAPDTAEDFGNFSGLLEYAKRLGRVQESMTGGGGIDYEPYTVLILKPDFPFKIHNIDYTSNSMGLRAPEISMQKPAGVFRIVILGGSTVEGGFNEDWTISRYLQKHIEKKYPNAQVINGGVLGYSSKNELMLLITKIVALQPDMVVVFDGRNDIYYSALPGWKKWLEPDYAEHKQALQSLVNYPTGYMLLAHTAKHFVKKSSLIKTVFRWLTRSGYSVYPRDIKIQQAGVDAYLDNLQLIKVVLEAKGILGLIAFQPTLGYCKDMLTDYERSVMDYLSRVEKTDWLLQIKSHWPIIGRQISLLPPSAHVRFYDMSCVFSNTKETAYIDSVHYVPLGSRIIAANLANVIVRDYGEMIRGKLRR